MTGSPPQWNQIAWDGISLNIPAAWEPAVVLRNYLLLENDNGPACEIKWQQSRASFDPDRVLARFRKSLGRDVIISDWTVPESWQSSCPSFTVSGFRLKQAGKQNVAVLLYCPACHRTTLLRFYDGPARIEKTASQILASLADHSPDHEQAWSIFDIRFMVPTGAELVSHEFMPGRFTLCFNLNGMTVTLYRIRPAAAILKGGSLGKLGATLGGRGRLDSNGEHMVTFSHQATGLERLRRRLRRKPAGLWLRLCHLVEQNVILGVKGEGAKKINLDLLERIYSGFTITTNQNTLP